MSTTSTKEKSVTKEIIILAIPTIIEEVLSTLLQYVDTAMVGHLGEEATAAVSTTTTIGWLIGAFLRSIGIALLAIMSKSLGEGNSDKMKKLAGHAIILVFVFGALVGALALSLAKFIPIWMGTEENVRPNASKYFFIISIPMLFRASSLILGSCIRATLDTKSPMIVNLIANGINMILDYLLIYVADLKVTGAAIATAVSFTISGILMFIVFKCKKEFDLHFNSLKLDKVILKEIWKIALPAAGTQITSCLGYIVFAGLVSGMGTSVFAAHSIAVNAEAIFYIPGYGLSSATSAMIGVAFGEKNHRRLKKIMRLSTLITIGIMIVSGIVLYFCAYPLMRIFTSSINAAELGAKMLKIVAFTEPFFGLMIAMQGIFYGLGKTVNVFIIETFGMWGIRIVFTVLCTKLWHTGLTEVWYCMIGDNISKACLLAIAMLIFTKVKLPKLLAAETL
ncbi:putative efflux protein, MATE family [Neocallimastix lanati (nom. inval.)]|jgi:putative MATE family efflux protein|uniref:Multidrug-efflux transporter n=1 Tax=Neocallimastix californiae TaxID=1754190 RepID=A0A1Y2EUC8_9FUNG|nr:putative efflux protein, MATE family [Neocallimastix sp. JGI-2020a]ORY75182.1 putative efflux protein, MATE family [Neocallimastix californiae]|eukprot:ORY75182.1 putative efflux protein, MATE family [Neocallimastix californiae]